MNNKTKIIIGVGVAALLFLFRKQIFGGGNGGNGGNGGGSEETTPDTSGPSENIDAPVETNEDVAFKPRVNAKPNLVNVVPSDASPNGGANLTPRVDTAVFFSAPNSALSR
jgi:hypothetical protein